MPDTQDKKSVDAAASAKKSTVSQKAPNKRKPTRKKPSKNTSGMLTALPLGGVGEIGRNLMVYECNGDIALVDCGVSFPDPSEPGTDVVLADTRYLREHMKKIKGLFITHAHEDHIGAVAYLWDELNDCPVFVSPFARKVLENKLQQVGISAKEAAPRLVTIKAGEMYDAGCIKGEFVPITHSILEAFSIALHTPHGVVVHTGDYKFDPKPAVGHTADEKRLKELGDAGVLAMMGDSTNVLREEAAGSEANVIPHLEELMNSAKHRLFFSSFASNTGRLIKATQIAIEAGRKVCYLGRTANNMVAYAKDLGYFPNGLTQHIVDAEEAAGLARHKVMVFASGTQGEGNASLTRLSHGHAVRGLKVEEGDLILMSSKMIPGNERAILDVHNRLVSLGAEVIEETHDAEIHVSGHGGRPEIKKMFALLRPEIVVPVHGEYAMLKGQSDLAKENGVKTTLIVTNGQKAVLAGSEKPHVMSEEFPWGKNYIDGYNILDHNPQILQERRKMSYEGLVSAALVLRKSSKEIMGDIHLTTKGLLDEAQQKDLIQTATHATMQALGATFPDQRIDDFARARDVVRSTVRRAISRERGKKPIVVLNIVEV